MSDFPNVMPGKQIVFRGSDRGGTAELLRQIADWLNENPEFVVEAITGFEFDVEYSYAAVSGILLDEVEEAYENPEGEEQP